MPKKIIFPFKNKFALHDNMHFESLHEFVRKGYKILMLIQGEINPIVSCLHGGNLDFW